MNTFEIIIDKNGKQEFYQDGMPKDIAVSTINQWWEQLDHNGEFDECAPEWSNDGKRYGYVRDNEIVYTQVEA